MKLWFFKDSADSTDRKDGDPDGEKAVVRYLAWQFRYSFDCITEKMACTNAAALPGEPSGCTLVYWGPGNYSSVRYEAPDNYSAKQWRDRSDRISRNHLKHLKGLLARFRRQRVPPPCRAYADYQEKQLTLEIVLREGRNTIPLAEQLDLHRERSEAMSRAQAALAGLREQYRDSLSAELKTHKNAENQRLGKGKKWRF